MFSKIIYASTSGSVPSVPAVPELISATISSLTLSWADSLGDIDYELQMMSKDDKLAAMHGFITIYNGPESTYTVGNLKRSCNYQFKVRMRYNFQLI